MNRIWGIDIGTTSIGFAVIEIDEERSEGSIVHEGVRIFPEGREEKKLEPRNQARRAARLLRRQVRRRRLRRKFLREAFAEASLLPSFNTPEWERLASPRRADDQPPQPDPYQLRARGLREKLEPQEIGRALYSLCHRRGFLSARRIEERKDLSRAREKEEGKILGDISSLEERLQGRPLGEFLYLAGLEKADRDRLMKDWKLENAYLMNLDKPERIRGRHISREMVMDEFDRLWEAQSRFYPELLTGELKERLKSILLYQRPMFWRLQTVGQCWLEPGEPACAKGSWIGQQFLMLQHVNNLRVRFMGQLPRQLDPEERKILLQKLQRQENMTFAGVTTTLKKLWKERGLPGKPEINLEAGGETRLLGNAVEARLAKVFGDAWDTHPMRDRLRAELYPRLFAIYNRQVGNKRIELYRKDNFKDEITPARDRFIEEAQKDFNLTRQQADQLAEFEPPSGWLRFSEKAIRKLLPFMEDGWSLNEQDGALDQAYPGWRGRADESVDRLPSHPKAMPILRNPSVNRALNELRKVANNLLRAYGKPTLIRIELLRELKKTKKQRLEITSRYGKNRNRREEAKRDLEDKHIRVGRGDDAVDKWLLWKECDETCPYTGRKICFDDLFRRGEFQIEHIFPKSRSLDNNLTNLTLCATDVNKAKGNQTPFEFLGRTPEWEKIKDRLQNWVDRATKEDRRYREEKMKAFLREDYPQGQEFLEDRQRADSSYIAVEARKFLGRLGIPVEVVNGQVTAQLRREWGLDAILNHGDTKKGKNRADHRHHAVDALAVALTSRAFVKRLSDFYARGKQGEKPKLPQPWENFYMDAKQKTEAIIVSHRVQRKVSGPLHAQTYYGDTGKEEKEGDLTYRYFVTTKKFEDLSQVEIQGKKQTKIRDEEIERLVQHHVAPYDNNPKLALAEAGFPGLADKKTGEVREIRKVRLLVKQQKKLMVPVWPKVKMGVEPKTFADLGGNYCMAVYKLPDGGAAHDTVSLPEAIRRLAEARKLKLPPQIVPRTLSDGSRLAITLAPGEMFEITTNGKPDYFVVRYCNEKGRVFYKTHTMADDPKPEVSFGRKRFLEPDIRKVSVDPIGRVRTARD